MARVYSLFFLSGITGLAYQVVWSRLFHETFGVTVHAVATVLATFLGGLALGAWLLGKVVDRQRDPLRFYGGLEIAIAVTAVAGTFLIRALEPAHVWAMNRFESAPAVLTLTRVLMACLVMLPPTILMGGTLPAIVRASAKRADEIGREIGVLYALNTLGATVGTLAAGFVFIRWIGLQSTVHAAALLNLLIGLAAIRWAAGGRVDAAREPRPAEAAEPPGKGKAGDFGVLGVMALAGFVTLGLEVLWTRMLVMSVGTTTYAFVTVLASFLLGITLGSLLARRFVDRLREPRRALGWIQLGLALSILATLPLAGSDLAQGWLRGWGPHWLALITVRFGVSLLVLLVPTTLIGMSFPLAGRIWTRRLTSLGTRLGQLYGINTAGNIAGALVAGFVLIPLVGLQRGVVLLAALNLVNALWGFYRPVAPGSGRLASAAVPAAGIAGCLLLVLLWQPPPMRSWDESAADEVAYYREGLVATVKVLRNRANPDLSRMTVDGITIGQSVGGVDAKQQALAHFPFLIAASPPRTVLSIGLGTGVLIGEVARHPGVQSVDCLEISPSVIEAARLFDAFTGDVLDNPSVRVVNDDGVNFLRRSERRYDAIISDAKSRTAHAGNSLFFSTDYYELSRDHLAPDGLMVQWVPLEVPPDELAIILRSFLGVFSHGYVWLAPPHSAFLVGREAPLELDLAHVERQLSSRATAHLRRYGWRDAHGFVSLLVADRESLEPWLSRSSAVNSLDRPVLEFFSPRAYAVPPFERTASNLEALLPAKPGPLSRIGITSANTGLLRESEEAVGEFVSAIAVLERGDVDGADGAIRSLGRALALAPDHGFLRHASLGAYRRAVAARPDSAAAQQGLAAALAYRGLSR